LRFGKVSRHRFSLSTVFAIASLLAGVGAAAANPIKELLGAKVGETVCFAGTFKDRKINLWDYAKARQVPVPGLFQFGKPVTRAEPAVYVDRELLSLTILIARGDRKHESYDEIHDFRLKATLRGWPGALYSAGECPWRASDRPMAGTSDGDKANAAVLYCGVSCDGGGLEVERVGTSHDVLFRFHVSGGGLRMSGGCSLGQLRLGGRAEPFASDAGDTRGEPAPLRLTQMSNADCAAFRKSLPRVQD
jgi:hypothetical protein